MIQSYNLQGNLSTDTWKLITNPRECKRLLLVYYSHSAPANLHLDDLDLSLSSKTHNKPGNVLPLSL